MLSPPRHHPPAMTLERRFPKTLDTLDALTAFLHDALAPATGNAHVVEVLTFGTEEFFTNALKYGRTTGHDILIRILCTPEAASVQMVEDDTERFDVTQAPSPDLTAPVTDRRPGGLGIHLSRELLDDLSYDYNGTTSTITMTMNLRD
jgi:anti-sigma regulatory factor (Ser/Thr protein kinase)